MATSADSTSHDVELGNRLPRTPEPDSAAAKLDKRVAQKTGVIWSQVLSHQDWGTVLLLVAFGIALAIANYNGSYAARPSLAYDASISLPMHPDTIHYSVAVVIPIINMLITMVVIEYVAFRSFHSRTVAATALIHFLINAFAAFVTTVFFVELFKRVAGRLRPDYLSRCLPTLTGNDIYNNAGQLNLKFGSFSAVACTQPDDSTLEDGHMAFPSGHSATAMFFAVYVATYATWSLYFRPGTPTVRQLYHKRSGLSRAAGELGSALVWLWVLWQLGFAWGVGVSRFRDNRHNISDILGGFLLAATFAVVYAFRAMGMYDYFMYDSHNPSMLRGGTTASAAQPGAERITQLEEEYTKGNA